MRFTASAALVLALSVAGCSGKKEASSGGDRPGEGKTSRPSTEAAAAPTPGTKRVEATSFKFGRALAADGTATDEGGPFAQGETLYVTFKVINASPGVAFKIVVMGLDDKRKVHEEQKNPAGSTSTISFSLPDTRSWPAGNYRLEMQLIEGAEVQHGTFDFKITPPKR
jgi:hypothetical protein